MINIFSRKEVLGATKTSSNKLQYLERKGLISPHRIGKNDRATVFFSLEQMIAIALDEQLKNIDNDCADSLIKFVANFDRPVDFNYAGTSLYCVDGVTGFDFTSEHICKTRKNPAQYTLVLVPDLGEILAGIIINAKNSDVIDFESFRDRVMA